MKRALAAIALLSACSDPPLRLQYVISEGTCGTDTCDQLPMLCDGVLHLRIFSPDNPRFPHVVMCEDLNFGNKDKRDLCALGALDLPQARLPRETLEVQVSVLPRYLVADQSGNLDCSRVPVEFDAVNGFPTTPGPAYGGRAFYHAGDSETVVVLGCNNVEAVNSPVCSGVNDVEFEATVLHFEDLNGTVSEVEAKDIRAEMGEPIPNGDGFQLPQSNVAPLLPTTIGNTPVWRATLDLDVDRSVCLVVSKSGTTDTLRCKLFDADEPPERFNISGVLISPANVTKILSAVNLSTIGASGITIGIVVDQNGDPIPNVAVTPTDGTIVYLDQNLTGIALGAEATTASGVFVSLDAKYGTTFSLPEEAPFVGRQEIGGGVAGKITFVHFGSIFIGG